MRRDNRALDIHTTKTILRAIFVTNSAVGPLYRPRDLKTIRIPHLSAQCDGTAESGIPSLFLRWIRTRRRAVTMRYGDRYGQDGASEDHQLNRPGHICLRGRHYMPLNQDRKSYFGGLLFCAARSFACISST